METIVHGKELFGDAAAVRAKQTAAVQYRTICVDGSIVALISEDRGPPTSATLSEEAADEWLESYRQSDPMGWLVFFSAAHDVKLENQKDRVIYLRKQRMILKDYHTHQLTINCIKKSTVRHNYVKLLVTMTLPPLVTMLAGIMVVSIFPWISKSFKWLSDGFRVASDDVGSEIDLPSNLQMNDIAPAATVNMPSKSRRRTGLSVTGAIIGLCLATVFANGLSDATKQLISGLRDSGSRDILEKTEADVRERLPISVGADVMAVDIEIEENSLLWTYQVKSADALVSAIEVNAFMIKVEKNACKVQFVRDVTAKRNLVTYELIDVSGNLLARKRINSCI